MALIRWLRLVTGVCAECKRGDRVWTFSGKQLCRKHWMAALEAAAQKAKDEAAQAA